MRPILSLALLLFIHASAAFAQNNLEKALSEVYNAQACGCATDLEGLSDKETAKAFNDKFNLDELKKSIKGNEKAQKMLETLSEVNKADKLNKELSNILNTLNEKPKQGDFIAQLRTNFQQIEQSQGDANTKAKFAACQLTAALHRYYLQYPDEAPKGGIDYLTYASKLVNTAEPAAQANKNEPEDKNLAANPSTNPANTAEMGLSDIVFHPITLASILLNLLLIFLMLRKKDENPPMLEQELNQAKERNRFLEQENATLKKEILQLQVQVNELSQANKQKEQEIAGLHQMIQHLKTQQIKVVQQPEQEITPQLPQQNKTIYLDAPTSQGVFYSNSISEQKGLNSLYKVKLAPNEQEGELELIKDEAIIKRAESMFSELIDPACEVHSTGRINPASLQQTPGKVRREGAGWRIEKKVILTW